MTTVRSDKYQTIFSHREVIEEEKPYKNHPAGHCFMVFKLRELNKVPEMFSGYWVLTFSKNI